MGSLNTPHIITHYNVILRTSSLGPSSHQSNFCGEKLVSGFKCYIHAEEVLYVHIEDISLLFLLFLTPVTSTKSKKKCPGKNKIPIKVLSLPQSPDYPKVQQSWLELFR